MSFYKEGSIRPQKGVAKQVRKLKSEGRQEEAEQIHHVSVEDKAWRANWRLGVSVHLQNNNLSSLETLNSGAQEIIQQWYVLRKQYQEGEKDLFEIRDSFKSNYEEKPELMEEEGVKLAIAFITRKTERQT